MDHPSRHGRNGHDKNHGEPHPHGRFRLFGNTQKGTDPQKPGQNKVIDQHDPSQKKNQIHGHSQRANENAGLPF